VGNIQKEIFLGFESLKECLMQRWEYSTTLIEADMEGADPFKEPMIPEGDHPKYSPFALIPELNSLGEKGWELVSFTPVKPGRNHDVVLPGAGELAWARHYLCVFKRPSGG
jgi:hypothetical protein